ncbi:MAG: glucose-6-phosphate dehydrogenase, partial [Rhodobacteraceae bacterium]|nr:glucose-6-phosphate dehydrogenase [Paracoccaceae bacterium]
PAIINGLKSNGLAHPNTRIVVEKPFGTDLESARTLNRLLASAFDESQVYRIDHYLGKETVQNLMALRFANVLFEPLWNSRYIKHIQITVAESTGVAGRGDYYDRSGALRDMVQNHLMQLLCLVAMEPPARFDASAVRDEKLKVINALLDLTGNDIILGQYADGEGQGSYRQDVGNSSSTTESYVALKCRIANWRWSKTPFYLRTGKRLSRRVSEIVVQFRALPHWIFEEPAHTKGNSLTIRLQPDEGIDLRLTIKEPGPGGMRLVEVPLDMSFAKTLTSDATELINAYERLIMDVIRGNQTLFMRSDEIEAAWRWTDAAITTCQEQNAPLQLYSSGSEGPLAAEELLKRDGVSWRPLETPPTPEPSRP